MFIKQISIFLENKSGRMAQITGLLAENQINIHALTIAETTDFGILRLIVSDPDKAAEILKSNGIMAKATNVVAVAMEHKPGGLAGVMRKTAALNLSIEYMYAFAGSLKATGHDAVVILKLTNQDEAVKIMSESGIKIINSDEILKER